MRIKQKITSISISVGIITLFIFPVITSSPAMAECGGVATAIINCSQNGPCPDGTNAYEGQDPGSDSTKTAAYTAEYKHDYGKCADGSTPTSTTQTNGIWGILLVVINILTAGVGVLAIAGVVYGSILYASAGGSADQVKKARGVITNVVIGIIAYALMYALINFIVPGGVFR